MTEIQLKTTCTAPNGICPYIMSKNECISPDIEDGLPRVCPYLKATRQLPQKIQLYNCATKQIKCNTQPNTKNCLGCAL